MIEPGGSVLHQQALTVCGLLTGFTLTALVLILNSPQSFLVTIGPLSPAGYFQIVATYVALVGATSSVAMVAYLEIAGGLAVKDSALDTLGTVFFLTSVFGFLGILPLLILPFTGTGAGVVVFAEVFLVGTYFVVRRIRPLERR